MPRPDMRPRSSNASNTPPSLPPIPRVVSTDFSKTFAALEHAPQTRLPPPPISPYNGGLDPGFLGGVHLQAQRRDPPEPPRPPPSGDSLRPVPQSRLTRSKPPPPPINTNFARRPPPVPLKQTKPAHSFVAPTDLQTSATASKRPAGTRLVSEPASLAAAQLAPDAQKAKKLPFLKNPMSTLLNRKKIGQHEGVPPPVVESDEPVYAPIRGTRVHDFSAPRPPRKLVSADVPPTGAAQPDDRDKGPRAGVRVGNNNRPFVEYGDEGQASALNHGHTENESRTEAAPTLEATELDLQVQVRRSLEQKPLPEQPIPPIPPKSAGRATRPNSSTPRTVSMDADGTKIRGSTPSTASRFSRASRNASMSGRSTRDESEMPVPRHMKSTSSRFSFMLGSANQELLLEERHRQKQLEKDTVPPVPSIHRDSRFDDFNEDDFDYDAMMEDDGLEERIPGVNADADEDDDYIVEPDPDEDVDEPDPETDQEEPAPTIDQEEPDPDNDQENFAGFVFQRSSQPSTLPTPVSPGMLATPRDPDGKIIGFAMTKDTTTPGQRQAPSASSASPIYLGDPDLPLISGDAGPGFGIHGLNAKGEEGFRHDQQQPPLQVPPPVNQDDLYYDQGLADELDFDGAEESVPFDESIFDNNDTDRYGRPIPGAFAQAQAMRAALAQDSVKATSDATSRLSGQSQLSQSTAHTSLSVAPQRAASSAEKPPPLKSASLGPAPPPGPMPISDEERVAAYQAALAQAAHQAAASGKFRRDSSPPPVVDLTASSAALDLPNAHANAGTFEDYDDDPYTQNMDDYDCDDDDIVAEANAEALASDMDGFYGQEFGFYSAPAQQGHGPSASAKVQAPLNAQNLFEYSNGGYFGPSGVGRSGSGHIVSREPNLTPITERSEYSNRNSIMSLGLPPIGSASELRSPGLAQLAMMADDGDMTLSALMRLRNKAFGGSQASLAPSSREGSPQSAAAERDGSASPWGAQSGFLGVRPDGAHGRKNSAFSLLSRESEPASGAGSPTLTMNFAVPGMSTSPVPPPLFSPPQPSPCPPVLEDEDEAGVTTGSSLSGSGVWMKSPGADPSQSSLTTPSLPHSASSQPQRRPGMGHRHKGSGDSISYMKEKGVDDNESRWVMERRRTAEGGQVEILGRQVVNGGRI